VRPSYFFDDEDADRTEEGLRLLATLRDTEARNIAARLPGYSADSLQVISKMLDRLGELEGLPNSSATGQAPAGALDRSETDGANPDAGR
jgi:hypothetical protein